MRIIGQVLQNDNKSDEVEGEEDGRAERRHRVRRRAALGGATILVLVCATGGLPREPLVAGGRDGLPLAAPAADGKRGTDGKPGAGTGLALGAPQRLQARTASQALTDYAKRLKRAETRRVAAAKSWGLRKVPLRAPAPPEKKPKVVSDPGLVAGRGLPPVVVRAPTKEKVVFLTIDDGADKDPRLLRMLRELGIPYSAFLSDYVARDDYGYFRTARDDGAGIHNHTINHRELPTLSYAEQRREICRQQDVLEKEIGERPTLFRPPYGAYDRDTLRAAATCGVKAVPLWAQEAFSDRIEWSRPDKRFWPGDIVLTHFRGEGEWAGDADGDMIDMLRRLVDEVTRQGFAFARLEDYL
jgi:peptidoglycan/xylan/chitin deacetylase (PgdA/CDA1 family)